VFRFFNFVHDRAIIKEKRVEAKDRDGERININIKMILLKTLNINKNSIKKHSIRIQYYLIAILKSFKIATTKKQTHTHMLKTTI
jgi:hypothetical protein